MQNNVLASVIAVLGIYIAFSQWRVARGKFKLDLFAKRYDVFKEALQLLSNTATDAFGPNDISEFRAHTAEAPFLFEDDVLSFLNKIESNAISVKSATAERETSIKWADEQLRLKEPARLFGKYMTLKQWR
jgi:hypothetical protein